MKTKYETLEVLLDGDVAAVVLNRPEVHNAFNSAFIAEVTEVFGDLAHNEDIHIVVLSGNGKSFCAGADVNWMRASLDLTERENTEDALRMSDMFAAVDEAPQAVVGKVHGAALGGGMGLIAVCDIVVADEQTRFGFTETRLGIIPAVISRFVMAKTGPSWVRRLFLTGERFDAARALQIGLVHEVVAREELDAAVDRVIGELRQSGPCAIGEAKQLIARLMDCQPKERRAYTAGQIARVRTSPEGQEGLRAFLEKREPRWRES